MKNLIITALVVLLPSYILSCDFCNCYLGLNPHYKKNSIGFRYHFQPYNGTEMSSSDLSEMGLNKNDFYEYRNDFELHGQYYPTQKLQLLASLPYVYNQDGMSDRAKNILSSSHHDMHHEEVSAKNTYQGIGDLILFANYQIFNKMSFDSSGFNHRLLAGPGLRVPTGKISVNNMTEAHLFTHQPGLGSWNPMAGITYLTRIGKMGTMLNATYMIGSENKYNFKSGNKLNVNLTGYYQVDIGKWQMFPNAGYYWENASHDYYRSEKVINSGGNMSYLHVGTDVYFRKFSIDLAFQLPVQASMNGYQSVNKYRLITGVSYIFN